MVLRSHRPSFKNFRYFIQDEKKFAMLDKFNKNVDFPSSKIHRIFISIFDFICNFPVPRAPLSFGSPSFAAKFDRKTCGNGVAQVFSQQNLTLRRRRRTFCDRNSLRKICATPSPPFCDRISLRKTFATPSPHVAARFSTEIFCEKVLRRRRRTFCDVFCSEIRSQNVRQRHRKSFFAAKFDRKTCGDGVAKVSQRNWIAKRAATASHKFFRSKI